MDLTTLNLSGIQRKWIGCWQATHLLK